MSACGGEGFAFSLPHVGMPCQPFNTFLDFSLFLFTINVGVISLQKKLDIVKAKQSTFWLGYMISELLCCEFIL